MSPMNGVPMFKLKPSSGLLLSALFALIIGGLFSVYLFQAEYDTGRSGSGLLAAIVTLVIVVSLVIAATARMWFRHLWHHRPGYRRG